MAPVIRALRAQRWAEVSLLATSQHADLVRPLLGFFGLAADHDLNAMVPHQSLPELTARILAAASRFFAAEPPDWVIAQGDTTTVVAVALACFYAGIPFAHVEAGLRTGDLQQPFPEEFNRALAAKIARLHFAPTERARDNLLREGAAPDAVFVTGNTVIDALLWTAERNLPSPVVPAPGQQLALLTLHRRESFGAKLRAVFAAIRRLLARNPDLLVAYPVHPNPEVRSAAEQALSDLQQVRLLPPLLYPHMVALLQRADLVLTDSGGIQEEAPALGKPVLVLRNTTERPEPVHAGVARVIGTDPERIVAEVERLLHSRDAYAEMARTVLPYGDGRASSRIVDVFSRLARPLPAPPEPPVAAAFELAG